MLRSTIVIALLAASSAVAAAPPPATPRTYEFSYVPTSGPTISGTFVGVLQPDNNSIAVNNMIQLNVGSFTATNFTVVDRLSSFLFNGPAGSPLLSFDGSVADLIARSASNNIGVVLNAPIFPAYLDALQGINPTGFPNPGSFTWPSAVVSASANNVTQLPLQQFQASNWSLNAVPEPSSWAMLITGFGLVGALARRRRVAAALPVTAG